MSAEVAENASMKSMDQEWHKPIEVPPFPPRQVPDKMPMDIFETARSGKKIEAIRAYRNRFGVSLKEAVAAINDSLTIVDQEPLANWEQDLLNDKIKKVYQTTGYPDFKTLTTYIAGPMRGFPNYNYDTFNAVAKVARAQNWEVHNPAENFSGEQGLEWGVYMRHDVGLLLKCNAIILLPGWEKSEGARLEVACAKAFGLIFHEAFLEDLQNNWLIRKLDEPPAVSNGIEAIARKLVYGDRNESYGPPAHDFECTGRKWAATLSAHLGKHFDDIPPEIVSVMMMDLKTSRLGSNPTHYDSRVDVIGYALCHDRIVTDDGRK